MSTETRVVDPNTGGAKGSKDERFDLIPARPLIEVARHFGVGARKYESRNWERGYSWSLSFAALQRHAWAFWGGEDIDPETKTSHMAAVVFHALALMEWGVTHPEFDDRVKPQVEVEVEPTDIEIPRAAVWPPYSWDTTDPDEAAKAKVWLESFLAPNRGEPISQQEAS